jgi:CheY-like chemotaxis protein/HPt (histidine-containing phosphotransfer) domain-containing protein
LLGLINDILDFSKIEAGKLDLEIVDFDLRAMLEGLAGALALEAQAKGLELVVGLAPGTPSLVRGDPGRLRQILANLAGNALKFTAAGEVAVSCAVAAELPEALVLQFTVRDTGIGIPQDRLEMLFDKFSQVDASTTRQYGGTGLGLAISRELVEMMEGEIQVSSVEGQGSLFTFTVPLGRPSVLESPEPELAEHLKGGRVLVVDDNQTSGDMLVSLLNDWGLVAEVTQDPAEVVQILTRERAAGVPFRIILIDGTLPEIESAEFSRRLKSEEGMAEVPLVLLASLVNLPGPEKLEEAGFDGAVTKPISSLELKSVLIRLLDPEGNHPSFSPASSVHGGADDLIERISARKARILLAEDNVTNQQVALGILKKFGLSADAVANGEEAVQALITIPYDLVLMDVQMPEMDGLEATRRIRNPRYGCLDSQVPIVAMTAHAMAGDKEKCLEAGMNDYISKPVDPDGLAQALTQWLTLDESPGAEHSPGPSGRTAMRGDGQALPVWDREGMLERVMGDQELVENIIEVFVDDIPLQIEKLRGYLDAQDAHQVEHRAHTIKGAAANVGGEALKDVARAIEQAGRNEDLGAARASMAELEVQFATLDGIIRAYLAGADH